MNPMMQTELNIVIPLVMEIAGLALAVFIDPHIPQKKRRILFLIILMSAILVLDEFFDFCAEINGSNYIIRTIIDILDYSIRPAIIVLFCCIVDNEGKHLIDWILVVINTMVHMTALFSHVCFWITEDNYFIRGPLGYTCHVISVIIMIHFVYLLFRLYGSSRKVEGLILIFCELLIIITTVTDSFGGELRFFQVAMLLPAIVNSCVFLYIWLHLQFVREHENDIMAQQRINIMVSQMKPHFIYNSLTVIGSYLNEPQKAEEALENFTGFLRGSVDFLDSTECIPAVQEFKTVDHFLYLEKERFGDKLNVELDIRDMNYKMPAFTVQTLVENAISHGIRHNKNGRGTLIVKSYELDKEHVIEVQDDGIGFKTELNEEMKIANKTDIQQDMEGRSHIGLLNLKERLEYMCNGTLSIQSQPGNGTLVKVTIPKKSGRSGSKHECIDR